MYLAIIARKEIKEIQNSVKTWVIIILASAAPYIFKSKGKEDVTVIIIASMMMAVCQYIYDSYSSDLIDKSALFFYNITSSFFEVYFVKLLFALIIGAIIFLVNIPNWSFKIIFFDLFWIFPSLVFSSSLMQFFSVVLKGAEIASAIIATILIFLDLYVIFSIKIVVFKILVSIVTAILLLIICNWQSKSVFYRSQL